MTTVAPPTPQEIARLDRLTPAQHRIAVLIANGLTTDEIAAQLGIAVQTAKNHTSDLLKTLGATHRTQVARLVLWHHLASGTTRAKMTKMKITWGTWSSRVEAWNRLLPAERRERAAVCHDTKCHEWVEVKDIGTACMRCLQIALDERSAA
jgi:DNA-binding CsgD family transcriptional regulator